MKSPNNLKRLINTIYNTNQFFLSRAQKQVNAAMTLRNWLIGLYIVEYEQSGEDRAAYGHRVLETLAVRLREKGLKGMAETNLKLFRQFYHLYPQIRQTVSDQLEKTDLRQLGLRQAGLEPLKIEASTEGLEESFGIKPIDLINTLSFSHFIELLKVDGGAKRRFYERQAIKNNWGVRDLKRAVDSLLYERTGLSTNKESISITPVSENESTPESFFRNTYLLEFLGLEEKPHYTESDLEERIITHLQNFLLELGRGSTLR